MAYATVAELKTYLGISGSGDDALLSDLLDRATAFIESYTGKSFTASTETRYFDYSYIDDDDRLLILDEWLLSAATVKDADGNTISSDDYVLLPRNGDRYHSIRLKSAEVWGCTSDEDASVSVAGEWGWSSEPPDDIKHVCIRLAGYYYRQRDAQVFDVTAQPDTGTITIPQGLPADVRRVLDRYREVW